MAEYDTLGRQVGGRYNTVRSDPEPAIYLRTLLNHRRQRGEPWDEETFTRLASVVVRGLAVAERIAWSGAFDGTRDAWRAAYRGELVVRVGLADPERG